MIKLLYAYLVMVLVLTTGIARAQQPLAQTLGKLQQQAAIYPYEKVYLHLDKPYYAACDTIWFKAYTVVGPQHRLDTLSHVLHVELIGQGQRLSRRMKLSLIQGLAFGDIILPDTLPSGNYHIRAYTNWMLNDEPPFLLDQPLLIFNPTTQPSSVAGERPAAFRAGAVTGTAKNQAPSKINTYPDVQFFPESGQLIDGITSKVAFKVVGPDGLGMPAKGVVLDEQNQVVAQLNTIHLGMGSFMFTPRSGKNYHAQFTFPDGTTTIDLPKSTISGYVMSVDALSDPINIIVKINGVSYERQIGAVTLIARAGGEIYLQGKGTPGLLNFRALVPRAQLPSGVVQFTLFSATGEPMNERLIFVQKPDSVKLTIDAGGESFGPRQKVKIGLSAVGKNGQGVQGNFSVAVIDESKVAVDGANEHTICSSLLLTSDIRGYVEQPNYYFNQPTDQTRADLDLLLLTQGYHRFEWKQVMGNVPWSVRYQPEKTLTVSGSVSAADGLPAAKVNVSIMSTSVGLFTADTLTDVDGHFAFHVNYPDSSRFLVKVLKWRKKGAPIIKLDEASLPTATLLPAGAWAVGQNQAAGYIENSKKNRDQYLKLRSGGQGIALKEVTIKGKSQSERQKAIARAVQFSTNLNGKGRADQIVIAADIQSRGCFHLTDCLQGLLSGVIFDMASGRLYLPSAFTTNKGQIQRLPMEVVIDGKMINLNQGTTLDEYVSINEIESIEVLRSNGYLAMYGKTGGGGVLIITTKHGNSEEPPSLTEKNNTPTLMPLGFYKSREFYSPRYDRPGYSNTLTDLRTTVYWNPEVITDEKGNASFEYFNGDNKGKYRIVVEGIDTEGHLFRQVNSYTVK